MVMGTDVVRRLLQPRGELEGNDKGKDGAPGDSGPPNPSVSPSPVADCGSS
jgi:hypothetical protein